MISSAYQWFVHNYTCAFRMTTSEFVIELHYFIVHIKLKCTLMSGINGNGHKRTIINEKCSSNLKFWTKNNSSAAPQVHNSIPINQ